MKNARLVPVLPSLVDSLVMDPTDNHSTVVVVQPSITLGTDPEPSLRRAPTSHHRTCGSDGDALQRCAAGVARTGSGAFRYTRGLLPRSSKVLQLTWRASGS